MATYLLDTSVIIDVLRGRADRRALLAGLLQGGNTLACCAINVAEVYAGMKPHEASATDTLLESLDYYEITWRTAKRAGRLKFDLSRRGRTHTLADAMIAATALDNQLTLVTDNVRDFRIPGLRLHPLS
jgi:predicted nucleic acid-binding protein